MTTCTRQFNRRVAWLTAMALGATLSVGPMMPVGAGGVAAPAPAADPGGADSSDGALPPPEGGTEAVAGLRLRGHGYGHGIGMGQYGALGYAVDYGWSTERILAHYYGGTVAGTVPHGGTMTVRLTALDDQPTSIVSFGGSAVLAGAALPTPSKSVLVKETAPGTYTVWARSDVAACAATLPDPLLPDSGWTPIAVGVPGPVTVSNATDTSASTQLSELLAVCEPSGRVRWYRGAIRAANGTDGENRSVNVVDTELYLRSVVASEMPASWGNAGGGKGMRALEVQAVAARSYALRQSRYSYARTCDTQSCQVYKGAASASSISASPTWHEQSPTNAAIAATPDQVRRMGSSTGAIASTMFASSTGGYTAPTSSPGYPAVADLGDATAVNPYHDWTVDIAASRLSSAFPSIGEYRSFDVLSRNGLGADGGRALTVRVTGTTGSATMSGNEFRRALGLRSDWYTEDRAACGAQREPPVITRVATTAGGFVAGTRRRAVDTRVGRGAPRGPLVGGCVLALDIGAPSGATGAVVNVITVGRSTRGHLTLYACGTPRPVTSANSVLNARAVALHGIVPLVGDRRVCVFSSSTTDVIVDIVGWIAPGKGFGVKTAVARRIADSRAGRGSAVTPARPLVVRLPAAPSSNAWAAVNVTLIGGRRSGSATIAPCGAPTPPGPTVNAAAGEARSNLAWVSRGSGALCVTVTAAAHVVVDFTGWLAAGGVPLSMREPTRLVDSRLRRGALRLRPAIAARVVLGTPGRALPLTITMVNPAGRGNLVLHSCATKPAATTVVTNGETVAAFAATVLGQKGELCVTSSVATDLAIDG